MKVGDLVRETGLQGRTGVIVEDLNAHRRRAYSEDRSRTRLFKVLWNELSPTLPALVGPAWYTDLEVISESR